MLKNRTFFVSNALFALVALGLALIFVALPGCGAPTADISAKDGKTAILEQVDAALTQQNCSLALTEILPIYNSTYSDNSVRIKTASAYGCDAGIDLITLIDSLISSSAEISTGSGFWTAMTRLFPSKAGSDYRVEGAVNATTALQASVNDGAIVLPIYQTNTGTNNIGSVFTADRTSEANLYQIFVSMAAIGSIQNRQGPPYPNAATYQKSQPLTWTTATAVDSVGCAYAASILNLLDSIQASKTVLPSNVGSSLSTAANLFQQPIDLACNYGCLGTVPAGADGVILNTSGGWVATGCAIAGGCGSCPSELRDLSRCTAQVSDKVSCAAAGIVNFINNSGLGWQG